MSAAVTIEPNELVGAHVYLANYDVDVYALSTALIEIPISKSVEMAALILGGGLMQAHSRWFRLCHRIVKWRTKQDDYAAWLSLLSVNDAGTRLAADVIMQTAMHAINGHDTVDENSVGGFCQDEINRLSWCMHLLQVNPSDD